MSAAMSGSSSTTRTLGGAAVSGVMVMATSRLHAATDRFELFPGQGVVRVLGRVENPAAELLVVRVVPVLPEPVLHVRETGHGADLDVLASPHERCGHA